MNEDIPLSIDVPAVALKLAQCRMSRLHVINDRFQCMGITGRANRERQKSTQLSRSRRGLRTAGVGHEHALPQPRLSARCWFSQRTFAGARGNGEVAPSAVIRGTASLQPGSTRNRSFIKHHRMRAAAGGDDNAAHGGRSLCGR